MFFSLPRQPAERPGEGETAGPEVTASHLQQQDSLAGLSVCLGVDACQPSVAQLVELTRYTRTGKFLQVAPPLGPRGCRTVCV